MRALHYFWESRREIQEKALRTQRLGQDPFHCCINENFPPEVKKTLTCKDRLIVNWSRTRKPTTHGNLCQYRGHIAKDRSLSLSCHSAEATKETVYLGLCSKQTPA